MRRGLGHIPDVVHEFTIDPNDALQGKG